MWINTSRRSIRDIRQIQDLGNAPAFNRVVATPDKKSLVASRLDIPSDCTVYLPLNNDMQNKIDGAIFTGIAPGGSSATPPTFTTQGNRKVGVFTPSAYVCNQASTKDDQFFKYMWGYRNFYWKRAGTWSSLDDMNLDYDLPNTNWPNNRSLWYYARRPNLYHTTSGHPGIVNEFTVALWCKTAANVGYMSPIGWLNSGWNGGYGGFITTHRDNARIGFSSDNNLDYLCSTNPTTSAAFGILSANPINDNVWHFVVARYKVTSIGSPVNGATYSRVATGVLLEVLLDNVSQGTTTTCWPNTTNQLNYAAASSVNSTAMFRVGNRDGYYNDGAAYAWQGSLAEVMWYTRYLEDTELTMLYNRGQKLLGLI